MMKNDLRSWSARSALIAATGLILVTSGCATGGADAANADCEETYTIGFSHPVGEAAFVKALKKQVEQSATEIGCVEVLFDSTQANDLESQRSTIETWVTQDVDAIVVLPVDTASLGTLQSEAQDKGIKWLTYASPSPDADGYTGFDNVASGTLVGEAAVEWYESRSATTPVSAAVTTLTALPDVAGRWEEPIELLEAAGVEVVSEQDCADQACGLELTETLLRENPDLRIFIGLNDDAALGAATAFTNAGIPAEEVFVAGQDGALEALEAIKAGGPLKVSAAIDLVDLAQAIVQNSINAVTGSGETETEAAVIGASLEDPAVLDELIAQLSGK